MSVVAALAIASIGGYRGNPIRRNEKRMWKPTLRARTYRRWKDRQGTRRSFMALGARAFREGGQRR